MLAKKQNFLEKIVKRNYNNELEKLLEEKQFEENAKSTLLNILYKIETGYKDIETVKKNIETKEEYIDIVIEQLERLRPEIIINRITGDPVKEDLIEPTWLLKKFCVLNDIDKEMVKRNSYQGKLIS